MNDPHSKPFTRRPPIAGLCILAALTVVCTCAPRSVPGSAGPVAVMDAGATAPPPACDDFYSYACGDWLSAHPIPPDASFWSPYDEITKKNRAVVQAILDEAARAPSTSSPVERIVGTYYAACMDEKAVEARGRKPLDPDLASIASITKRADLVRVIATLSRRGIDTVIDVEAEQDPGEATQVIAGVDRRSLPLRVRDNYLSDGDKAKSLRTAYEAYLTRVFGLLGEDASTATADAARVLELERALAAGGRDESTRRDPRKRYNPVVVAALAKGSIDWRGYFALLGANGVERMDVHDPDYFASLDRQLATADLATWRAYLRARLVHVMSDVLPAAFVQADFDFFQGTLRGTKVLPARWKRCTDRVDGDVGEALGQLFVARAFPEANKAKAQRLVAAVQEALRVELSTATWLAEPTRRAALAKLAAGRVKIGYPDHFRDYSSIRLARDDAFGNAERAATFELQRQLAKIGRPVDRDEWFVLPQTLDAYGNNQLNEAVFTAGFLQPPLFDAASDDASTFGSVGAVIGHELTHNFDDTGRSYDAEGNLRDWWTAEDAKEYASRAACFERQYSAYTLLGEHVDGQLTLDENIADNGGLRLAFRAAGVDGDAAAQRFFLGWARLRCGNITEENARARLRGDRHAPGRYRAIGAVANMPEFRKAFACPANDEPVCRLW